MKPKKPIQVFLENELFLRLKSKAARKNKTITAIITGMVESWLKRK